MQDEQTLMTANLILNKLTVNVWQIFCLFVSAFTFTPLPFVNKSFPQHWHFPIMLEPACLLNACHTFSKLISEPRHCCPSVRWWMLLIWIDIFNFPPQSTSFWWWIALWSLNWTFEKGFKKKNAWKKLSAIKKKKLVWEQKRPNGQTENGPSALKLG